jgi:hypothetical protein
VAIRVIANPLGAATGRIRRANRTRPSLANSPRTAAGPACQVCGIPERHAMRRPVQHARHPRPDDFAPGRGEHGGNRAHAGPRNDPIRETRVSSMSAVDVAADLDRPLIGGVFRIRWYSTITIDQACRVEPSSVQIPSVPHRVSIRQIAPAREVENDGFSLENRGKTTSGLSRKHASCPPALLVFCVLSFCSFTLSRA